MEISFLPSKMFVYPGPRVSPQGRNNYSFVRSDGTQVPAGRTFARKADKRYCFPLDKSGMKLKTGLDTLIDNPFQNEEFVNKYVKDQWASRVDELTGKEQITMQTYLEVVHNRKPGTYTDEKQISQPFDVEAKENTFFEKYSVSLKDGTNIFTSDTIDGQIAMLCMKMSLSIANSKEEYNPSFHDFYIGQEHEAAQEKATKRQKQAKAIATISNIRDNFDDFVEYQIAVVLRLVHGPVNPIVVREKIDNYLWVQDKGLIERLEKFQSVTKDIKKKESMERLYLRYIFQQALNTRVISIAGGSFIWHSKKGIQNLYNLGTKESTILNMFYTEMQVYDPSLKADNFYGDLINELLGKGVKLLEAKQTEG